MIKKLAKWLNRKEHQRIEAESLNRRKDDSRLLYLLDRLEEQDGRLREQVDLYETLLNGIPVMVWYIEDIDRMGICNQSCAEFFGLLRPDQLAGMSLHSLMSEHEAMICIENNRKVFEKREVVHSEEWVTRYDGVKRLWQITKTPKGNGHVKYAVCCGVDITDKYEAEHYRDALLKSLPDIVFVHDIDGYYLDCYANQNGNLVYPCEMIAGKHLSDCLPKAIVEQALVIFQEVLDTGNMGCLEYELELAGKTKVFEARIVPLDEDRLLSTIRDITVWKKAQENLAKQLTWQQEELTKCALTKDCPGSPDGTCRKTLLIGLDKSQNVLCPV